MPSEEWKIKNFKQKWFAGETISVGIGQGAVAITPVQLLRAISAISMGGRMVVPARGRSAGASSAGYVETSHVTETKTVPIDPNGWTFITDAMSRVCCRKAPLLRRISPGSISRARPDRRRLFRWPRAPSSRTAKTLAQNGWFVGFTPRRNPDIVVCVLFQGGEHGKAGGAHRHAGNQSLRRQAATAAQQDGREAEERRQSRYGRSVDRARRRQVGGRTI